MHAAIFDMDGLLLDTERISFSAWKRAVADFGYDLKEEVFLRMIGRTREECCRELKAAFGDQFPCTLVEEKRTDYRRAEIQADGIPLKPGARELLEMLRLNRIPCGLATSTDSEVAMENLRIAGLSEYFEVVVGGDQIENSKPAPDVFLETAKRLGFPADACLVLEDSVPGIRAAHAAGMMVVMVPDMIEPSQDVVCLTEGVFASLLEVRLFLQGRLKIGGP